VGAGGVGRMPLNNGGIVGPTITTAIIHSTATTTVMKTEMAALAPTTTITIVATPAAQAPTTATEMIITEKVGIRQQVLPMSQH